MPAQLNKLHKLAALLSNNCNAYLCVKPASRQSPVERLRSASSRYFLYRHPPFVRIPIKLLAFISWPLVSTRLCWKHYTIRRKFGKAGLLQLAQSLFLAWFEFIHPRYYYEYRFFEPSRMRQRGGYLLHRNIGYLFAALNHFAQSETINSKEKFAGFCRSHILPSPQTLLVCDHGKMTSQPATAPWPDFVVKPVYGNMGRDIRFGDAGGNGNYRYRDRACTHTELLQQIAQESMIEPCLVQERLYNHPDLAALTRDYLAVIRIVSYLDESNEPALLAAYLCIPYDDMINFSNTGWCFPLEMETGRILPCPLTPLKPEVEQEFAQVNKRVEGLSAPCWQEARDLVCKAHRLLPDYFSLGWDIAITPTGPAILETNIGWDTHSLQYSNDLPLGETGFARCALARLERLE